MELFRNAAALRIIVLCRTDRSDAGPECVFRGDNATSTMYLFYSVAITNRGTIFPARCLSKPRGISIQIVSISTTIQLLATSPASGLTARFSASATVSKKRLATALVTSWKSALIIILPT
jgi:general L-amino acid transport system permease protein